MFRRLLPILALLLCTSAFAVSKGSFSIDTPATISGHELPPGDYQAKWDGAGPAVQVSILSKGKLHSRDIGEPFDFLTWFEYAPHHSEAFEDLVRTLRNTEEWRFVDREVDIRLERD